MTFRRRVRASVLIIAVIAATLVAPAAAPAAADASLSGAQFEHASGDGRQITLKPIGRPSWRPTDFHVFSAPLGEPPKFEGVLTSSLSLFSPRDHRSIAVLGVGPGAPHRPPYSRELAHCIASSPFHQGSIFTLKEFSVPSGVSLGWMTVPLPAASRGSSPDFRVGPIIPNELFPTTVTAPPFHRGHRYDITNFSVPALDALDPPFDVDGHSHFPVFIADASIFGPAGSNPLGGYAFHVTMLDQTGRGWSIEARFVVVRG